MDDVRTVTSLSCTAAQRIIAAATEEARHHSLAMCVAVTDPGGNLLAFTRMDGAPLLSAGIAQDKAYTVTAFNGLPTQDWFDLIRDEPALLHGIVHQPRLVVFGGGVPVMRDGVLVGAVGVSGGSAEEDVMVATAGASALGG
jgi:uncharacterized protein GlcG (DUF336 family)